MDLTHGDLEGVRFGHLFSKQRHLIRCSEISSSQEKVTLVPRMLDSQGSLTIQLLLPLTHVSYRCQVLVLVFAGTAGSGFKRSDPTKKSDIYPMAMTILLVCSHVTCHAFVSYINCLTYPFSFFFPQLILRRLRSVFASARSLPFSILTLSLGSLSHLRSEFPSTQVRPKH